MFSHRSTMLALLDWFLVENDPKPRQYLDRMITGLWKIAVKEKDYCYYPDIRYYPSGWKKKGPPERGVATWTVYTSIPWFATGSDRESRRTQAGERPDR